MNIITYHRRLQMYFGTIKSTHLATTPVTSVIGIRRRHMNAHVETFYDQFEFQKKQVNKEVFISLLFRDIVGKHPFMIIDSENLPNYLPLSALFNFFVFILRNNNCCFFNILRRFREFQPLLPQPTIVKSLI